MLARPLRVPKHLLLSPATLVVAPPTLLNHWEMQLHKAGHDAQRVWSYCRRDSSKSGYALPPGGLPALAWQYDVVLTTREGLSHGHRAASLLAVHWLRIVVDEGHIVGGVNTARFARLCALSAERRWIMTGKGCVVLHTGKNKHTTGTPTPGLHGAASRDQRCDPQHNHARLKQELDALTQHLQFLHVPDAEHVVGDPGLLRWETTAHRALVRLLGRVMIRASKADVQELPLLHSEVVTLAFDAHHADSYNQLVAMLRVNLLTADWLDDNHEEALTHQGNSRRMRQFFNNLMYGCGWLAMKYLTVTNCGQRAANTPRRTPCILLSTWKTTTATINTPPTSRHH